MQHVLRELTPPLLWRAGKKVRRLVARRGSGGWTYGEEQPPGFYDWTFRENAHWRQHYTASHYYPLWTVVADRVQRAGAERVLDIGCGPGQVAHLLYDKGVPAYLGLDFSPARIEQARAVCPDYRFEVADVFETPLLSTWGCDCVLVMEFLEHVERDLDVLRRLRGGTRVIATVPNFPSAGHVRHFGSAEEVAERYGPCFASLEVEEHLANAEGRTYYLLEGMLADASGQDAT